MSVLQHIHTTDDETQECGSLDWNCELWAAPLVCVARRRLQEIRTRPGDKMSDKLDTRDSSTQMCRGKLIKRLHVNIGSTVV